MQLLGSIAGQNVFVLVDSGSSHSFLSSSIASGLSGSRQLPHPIAVRVADGATVQCTSELPDVEWSVQGHHFHSTLWVLPLSSYNMIVGMDWLEAFSPMKVHWRDKWMSIAYGNGNVLLQGHSSDGGQPAVFHIFQISAPVDTPKTEDVSSEVPPQVQALLDEFSYLFTEPSALHPGRACDRACDHTIPLVLGVYPVAVR